VALDGRLEATEMTSQSLNNSCAAAAAAATDADAAKDAAAR